MTLDPTTIDFAKGGGLVPAIIQHARTGEVLMLGYMNDQALETTLASRRVTFWSRSKNRLWTKGETSGDVLDLVSVSADCDQDALLVRAEPAGPTCHLGTRSCFGEYPGPDESFPARLEEIIRARRNSNASASYTARLLASGINKIAQKVGEEGVETALAGVAEDDAALIGEAADLIYHLLVLLAARNVSLGEVGRELADRHSEAAAAPDGLDDGG